MHILGAQLSSHVFHIATAETIPSDESPHKVIIAVTKFKSEFERVSTPKLSPHVYLRTEIENRNDFPYMPGDMHIFRGNHFIGSSAVEMVAPREKFQVFVGVDEGLKIVRTLVSKRVEAGAMTKVYYDFSIKVENFKSKKAKVTVIDQIPVARDSDVDVLVEPETTKPTRKDKDGKMVWELEIDAGKSKTIRWIWGNYCCTTTKNYLC